MNSQTWYITHAPRYHEVEESVIHPFLGEGSQVQHHARHQSRGESVYLYVVQEGQ